MNDEYEIVEIQADDFPKCFSFWDFGNEQPKQKRLAAEIDSGLRRMFAWVIQDEYVAGFSISFDSQEQGYFLSYLVVKEECRNKGICSRIIDYAADYLQKKGEKNMFLHVDRSNIAARRLYERKGFVLYDDPAAERITLIKAL